MHSNSEDIIKPECEIILIESSEVFLSDSESIINVPLIVNMPGVANIEMTIEGTAMKVNQKINVGIQKPKLSQVTASIEFESQVLENTFVELYSNKKDSRIYYVVQSIHLIFKFTQVQS